MLGWGTVPASESISDNGIAVIVPDAACPQQDLVSPLLMLCGQGRSWGCGASAGAVGTGADRGSGWGFRKNQGGLTILDFPIVCGLGIQSHLVPVNPQTLWSTVAWVGQGK